MLATLKPRSLPLHRLTRFVTKEAIARLLKTHPDQIWEVRRWAYVLLVVGKGISRFVSYADLPPIPNVAPPEGRDFRALAAALARKTRSRVLGGILCPEISREFFACRTVRVGQSGGRNKIWPAPGNGAGPPRDLQNSQTRFVN